jgi:hypothetical protein
VKRRIILLVAVVVVVVGVAAVGAAPASASSAPIAITYAKTCNELIGHCEGSAGNGGTFEMQVTGFRATGKAAHLTATVEITVGDISFTAEMTGHASPAGFIVLNGTITEGSFLGAQVHQRSNLVGADGSMTSWIGGLRLMPKSG